MRIDQVIEYHSIQRPGSLALVQDDAALSFGEMNRMSNQVAKLREPYWQHCDSRIS